MDSKKIDTELIVTARCRASKRTFGIRFEKHASNHWVGTWAFPVLERNTGKAVQDRLGIAGTISLADSYRGCPHCESSQLLKCECGGVACWDGDTKSVICPWCETAGVVEGIFERLEGGEDI